eukprot:366338-Chlamydomonas_euryale.AAC.17
MLRARPSASVPELASVAGALAAVVPPACSLAILRAVPLARASAALCAAHSASIRARAVPNAIACCSVHPRLASARSSTLGPTHFRMPASSAASSSGDEDGLATLTCAAGVNARVWMCGGIDCGVTIKTAPPAGEPRRPRDLDLRGGMYMQVCVCVCVCVKEDGSVEQLKLRQGHRNMKDFSGMYSSAIRGCHEEGSDGGTTFRDFLKLPYHTKSIPWPEIPAAAALRALDRQAWRDAI